MDPDTGDQKQIEDAAQAAAAMRSEAAEQLIAARELAKRVRADALQELEDARARITRIAAREEEMAQRWASLLEAENAARVARAQPDTTEAAGLIPEANEEARLIVQRAQEQAGRIREDAMHLLAIAEGEKAESREIAQNETDRAITDAERLRTEAEEEARRLREEALAAGGDAGKYSRGRKLPRIGENASNLLSEMSNLRARSAEEADGEAP